MNTKKIQLAWWKDIYLSVTTTSEATKKCVIYKINFLKFQTKIISSKKVRMN